MTVVFVFLEVFAVRLSCEGSSDRDRDRQRQRIWVRCWLRAIRSVLPLLRCISFHSFLMSERKEVVNRRLHSHEKQSRRRQAVAGQRQPEWQCAKCYTRNFLSKNACGECGKARELQKDSYVDERGLITPWPRQSGSGMTSGAAARRASTPKGPAKVLVQTRQQLAQAREHGQPEDCIRILECKVTKEETEMRQAQPMGQRMDQARARFRRAVDADEKAREAMQAQSDLHKLMLEAPLLVMPAPQVNMNLVKSLEALAGLVENTWNPEAGPPPDQLIRAIQESRATPQASSAILAQEGGAAVEAEAGARQDPELWDQDEDEAEEMADFEEAHAPGGPPVEPRQTRKAAAERAPPTPPQQKKTRTTEPEALAKGSAPL